MLTRPMRPQTDTTRGDPINNFDKLVNHIDSHVTADSMLNYLSCPAK